MSSLSAVIVLIVCVHLLGTEGVHLIDTNCPARCTCNREVSRQCRGLNIDCSHNKLKESPQPVQEDVVCLNISHNKIASLHSKDLKSLKGLEKLDLSHNHLKALRNGTFRDLNSLQVLNLSYNNLSFEITDLPTEVFRGLTNLKHLELHENMKKDHIISYRDAIFRHTPKLTSLTIDGLSDGEPFGKGFSTLQSLQSLSIYGFFDYIANGTFREFVKSQILEIYINSNLLYDLEPDSFAHFRNLTVLSLSYNPLLGLRNASKSWYGLQKTNITKLYLIACTAVYNGDHGIINEVFFNHLNKTNIKELYLDRNDIIHIKQPQFHVHLPHLEYLSLPYNRLQRLGQFFEDIHHLNHLTTLSLSHQLRTPAYSQPPHKCLGSRGSLNTSAIPECNLGIHFGFDKITLPPNLEVCLMAEGYYYDAPFLGKLRIYGTRRLKYLDFSNNQIKIAKGPLKIQHPQGMVWSVFRVQSNGLVHFDPNFLTESIKAGLKIETFDLYDNKLGGQLTNDTNGEVFGAYKDLLDLNLSTNEIKYLPKNTFKSLSKLQSLNLSFNSLRTLDFDFKHMINLKVLDLSSNLFSVFAKDEMDDFDELTKRHKVWIDLSNNPLMCSCESLEFLQWMPKSKVIFYNAEHYVCIYEKNMVLLENVYKYKMKEFEIRCSANTFVKAAASSASTVFVAMLLSIFLYHHRWDIKFFIIRMIAQGRKSHAENENHRKYQFDAFVAYHEDDKEWVLEQMIPMLEGPNDDDNPVANVSPLFQHNSRNHLRLCLHFRDFDGGTPITENIVEGITNSRKTILVLSNNFVQSHWCIFEIEMARMKCFDEGRNTTIVIMLEQVNPENMTGSLKALVKRYSYLTWPVDVSKEGRFWLKLREAVASPRCMPCVCECGGVIRYS